MVLKLESGSDSPRELVKIDFPIAWIFESVAPKWSPRTGISNNFPGDADSSVQVPPFENHCSNALILTFTSPGLIAKDFSDSKGSKEGSIFLVWVGSCTRSTGIYVRDIYLKFLGRSQHGCLGELLTVTTQRQELALGG